MSKDRGFHYKDGVEQMKDDVKAVGRMLGYLAVLMMVLLLVSYATTAVAQEASAPEVPKVYVAQFGAGQSVTLTTTACGDETVLEIITVMRTLTELPAVFQGGYVDWGGKRYQACWAQLPSSEILIMDDSGDMGVIPPHKFRELPVV